MGNDGACIFHINLPWDKNPFFSTKVKVICLAIRHPTDQISNEIEKKKMCL